MASICRMEAAPGSPDVIVGVISKLLEDLVSRNDQVQRERASARPASVPRPCAPPALLLGYALLLGAYAPPLHTAQLPLVPAQVTPFHSSKPPAITVRSYLEDRCGTPCARS